MSRSAGGVAVDVSGFSDSSGSDSESDSEVVSKKPAASKGGKGAKGAKGAKGGKGGKGQKKKKAGSGANPRIDGEGLQRGVKGAGGGGLGMMPELRDVRVGGGGGDGGG